MVKKTLYKEKNVAKKPPNRKQVAKGPQYSQKKQQQLIFQWGGGGWRILLPPPPEAPM